MKLHDAIWSGLEAAASAGFSIITSFLIARLLGPAELGAGAAASAVHVVLWVGVNALFADAIVQHPTPNDRMLSSAFWASSAVGGAAALIQAGSGFILASFLHDERLPAMALVLALPLPVVGAAGVMQGISTRRRAYRLLALRTIIGQSLGAAVGLIVAGYGGGAWAIVLQQAAASLFGAAVLLTGSGWAPARCLEADAIRNLLRVGLPLAASTLVLVARYRLFALVIGAGAGAAELGQVHLAFRMVDAVRELIFTAFWRLMLPTFSECQHDPDALLGLVDRWLRRCLAVVLPACVMLAGGLIPFVTSLLGEAWRQAGEAALPLVGLMALTVMTYPSGVALVATGGARLALYANLTSTVTACGLAFLYPPGSAWQAALLWLLSQALTIPYALWVNARALGVGLLRPVSGGPWLTSGRC